jgi:hypothetical protein
MKSNVKHIINRHSIFYLILFYPILLNGYDFKSSSPNNNTHDLFPLSKGSIYQYNYFCSDTTNSSSILARHIQKDSGLVEFVINDFSYTIDDKVAWLVEQRICLQRFYRSYDYDQNIGLIPHDTTYFVSDTTQFILNESLQDQHQLNSEIMWGQLKNPKFIWSFPLVSDGGTILPVFRYSYNSEDTILAGYFSNAFGDLGYDSLWFKENHGLYRRESYFEIGENVITSLKSNSTLKQCTVSNLPDEYKLNQNYPNPFNKTTNIEFQIPNTTDVSLVVYDILGRKVSTLLNNKRIVGRYCVSFNVSNLNSGIYFYTFRAKNFRQTKKMILIR